MNKGLFREYDIRGVAGTDIQEDDVENIGKADGSFLTRVPAFGDPGRHRQGGA